MTRLSQSLPHYLRPGRMQFQVLTFHHHKTQRNTIHSPKTIKGFSFFAQITVKGKPAGLSAPLHSQQFTSFQKTSKQHSKCLWGEQQEAVGLREVFICSCLIKAQPLISFHAENCTSSCPEIWKRLFHVRQKYIFLCFAQEHSKYNQILFTAQGINRILLFLLSEHCCFWKHKYLQD